MKGKDGQSLLLETLIESAREKDNVVHVDCRGTLENYSTFTLSFFVVRKRKKKHAKFRFKFLAGAGLADFDDLYTILDLS